MGAVSDMHTQLPGWAHGVLPPAFDRHILALAGQGRHANAVGLQPHCIEVHLVAYMDTLVHYCCDALTMGTGCQLLRKIGRFWRDPAIGSSCWPASPSPQLLFTARVEVSYDFPLLIQLMGYGFTDKGNCGAHPCWTEKVAHSNTT